MISRQLLTNYPDLNNKISARYLIYRKACHISKIEQSCKEVQQIVIKLHHQGEYTTESYVSELMANPGHFRYQSASPYIFRQNTT
jgi:hypothetical protein